MLVLCGSSISNYYNKVKLALLEKGVDFSEEYVATGGSDEAVLGASPLAKIPFLRTDRGPLCESQAILEYIETTWPEPPLLPRDPFAAAKVRELAIYVDLHLELVARDLYPKAFFGGSLSDGQRGADPHASSSATSPPSSAWPGSRPTSPGTASPRPTARPGTRCRWSRWRPARSTARTCSLPPASTSRATAGLVGERPSAQKVAADRKAEQAKLTAKP